MLTRILALCSCVIVSTAQPLQNPFFWTMDPGAEPDTTVLPHFPARTTTQVGRISVRDGKLVYPNGSRARLYGVTLVGPAAIPDSAQAIAVAKRLRGLGINLVRLIHFDYTNYNDASILVRSSTTSRGFDSVMLRRFDWFLAHLRQNGIYVALGVRSARLARRDDGIAGWDSIRYSGRMYSYFHPGYQMIVRDFVRDLLNHHNAFTGVRYADDPTIAIIELEQDNSIFVQWINNVPFPLSQGGQLSWLHSRMLDSAFVRFLLQKYRSEQAVLAAWRFVPRTTTNVVSNPSFEDPFDTSWLLNLFDNAVAIVERDPLDKKDGEHSMRIRISQPGTRPASVRYRNIAPNLQRYALYRIQLWARTDAPSRLVTFAIANFSIRDTLRQQWKEYTYTFRSNTEGQADFRIDAGGTSGDVWIDNVRITAVAESALNSGESLSNYTVTRSRYTQHTVYSLPRWRDNLEFYQTLAQKWFEWMRRLIRDTLRCQALIAPGNQVTLLNDVYIAQSLDLPAVATGWDSPYRRIAGATSDSSWYILNDPQLGNRSGGLLYIPTRTRIKGKPLMVNGYGVPYPSASQMEMTLHMPAYLSYQDADVYVLSYYAFNRSSLTTPWIRPRYGQNSAGTITHYEHAGNPALMSALPISAYVFRNQLISPAREELLLQQTTEALSYPPYNQFGAYFLLSGADARIPLFRRVAVDSFNASLQSYQPHREIPALADQANVNTASLLSDTEELLWNANDTVFIVRTPRYVAAQGVLRGKILDLSTNNELTIERIDNGRIGTVEILAMDTLLSSARRAILSLLTRTCATGAVWSGDSSTYQNWGTAPMQLEGMTMIITWRHQADSLRIIPLDSNGRPLASRARGISKSPNGRFRFTVDQRVDGTVWYAIELISRPITTDIHTRSHASFDAYIHEALLVLDVTAIPESATLSTALYTLDGRRIASWESLTSRSWNDRITLPLPDLVPGAYYVQVTSSSGSVWNKLLLIPSP